MYPCKRVRRALDAVTALEPSLPVRNVGCAVRSRAPGFISSAAGACSSALRVCPLFVCHGLWMCAVAVRRCACGAARRTILHHGPRRWFGAQAHAGCACIRPVSQDSRLASSLLRTVRTLADGIWESPAWPWHRPWGMGVPAPDVSTRPPTVATAVRVPRHPRIKGIELRG